ncbi:MAG: N-acetylmuramoyl-L-alanine amidase [Acidobacteriia bacterium]|nr:N-acetylmuramoyl-L-alanine amidase [Terriglobia bacterium]
MLRLGAALLLLLPALPARAGGHKSEAWARTQCATAERMREALNGRPSSERTRREYSRVINAYRRVYYGSPTSSKADSSVVAVAELQVEMGRRFDDDGILRSAIAQYQFLRREYPGSKYRFDALFTVGEIYQDDLNDPARARTTFTEFLRRYPRNHLAEEARQALAQPVQQASLRSKDTRSSKASDDESGPDDANQSASNDSHDAADSRASRQARVTSIRHWSTPDYTRVAIDLEQDVKYESQRIDHPDRIFFDLLDTKLASTLVGKTFDVDDGFLKKIRVAQFQPGKTRVVLEVDDLSDYEAFLLPNPSRLIIDIHGRQAAKAARSKESAPVTATAIAESKPEPTRTPVTPAAAKTDAPAAPSQPEPTVEAKAGPKKASTAAAPTGGKKKIVEPDDEDDVTVTQLDPPDIKPESKAAPPTPPARKGRSVKGKRTATPPELDVHEAQPNASGDRSLIRALGLKIGKIVIDPGHGGHDTGTIGPNGLLEKDLVLDVAKRLGKQLERLGAEVVYTRTDDTFIPLETRTAIANQEQADLFVSIHANSSDDPDARGVETYYLNFTSSADALEVAARENAVSEKSIHELQDLVKKIALKEKIEESHEFASDVQHALHSGLSAKSPGIRDRGVKKAPFIVLIGANMPSILAEISFVSNPGDERRLKTPEYRQKIAESLYRGISKYVSGLSGVKVASKIDKGEGQ